MGRKRRGHFSKTDQLEQTERVREREREREAGKNTKCVQGPDYSEFGWRVAKHGKK